VQRFLTARLRHAVTDVPDLIQEVFMRLLRMEHPETIRNPEAYLLTIARHVLHQHRIRHSAIPEAVDIADVLAELDAHPEQAADPAAQLEARQHLESLERALPRKAYVTLMLHRVGGMTLEKIAEELGVSRPMVKKYLAKALTYCREHHEDLE
jgi:RNA polymerase sigma-70 factor (ECF subfamily)